MPSLREPLHRPRKPSQVPRRLLARSKDTIDHNSTYYNTITKMIDLRWNASSNLYEVQCKWRGFVYKEPTWERFANLEEDLPDMLQKFMDLFPD